VTARGQINGPSGGVAEAVFEGLCQERPGTNWMWVSAPPMPINSALPVAPIQNADGPSCNGKRGQYQFDRTGRPSITKTERPRSASLLQMPRGLTCNLRQREREYGGPAGSLGIVPPFAAVAGAVLHGRAASRRPGSVACFAFCSGLFRPAPQKARLPAEHFRLSVVLRLMDQAGQNADRFRRIAEECRVQAAKATSPLDREAWLRLAEDWIKFAATIEARHLE
jgi:hypothetical protein